MKVRYILVLLVPTLLAVSIAREARADVSDADRATARALARQGQAALEKHDFAVAADLFSRAGSLVHAPTLMLGEARALLAMNRLVNAHELFARILREGAPAGSPPPFAKAVAAARVEMEAMEPRIPTVVITVKGPSVPDVTVDGVPVPPAALGVSRPVDPGTHLVKGEGVGFAPGEATFLVAEGKSAEVTLDLVPIASAPNHPVGPASAGTTTDATTRPSPPSNMRRVLGYSGIGVGAAGIILGGVTGAMAVSKHSTLANLCPDGHCVDEAGAIADYHTVATLSTVGFIAGGALAATGVVLVVTAPGKKPSGDATLLPLIGPGFVGVEGRF